MEVYRFSKFVTNLTLESPELETYDPVNQGYGLKSILQTFDNTEPVNTVTVKIDPTMLARSQNIIMDNSFITNLPPQSVMFTHDIMFSDPQNANRMAWDRGVQWVHGAYIDFKHHNIASPDGFFPPVIELGLMYADWIVVLSDSFKEYLVRTYGRYIKNAEDYILKIRVYRSPKVFSKKDVDRKKLLARYGIEYKEGQKIILNVGRTEALMKNTQMFNEIAEGFWKEGRDEYIFVKIGGIREKTAIKRKNILHLPKLQQNELALFYSISDLYLSTSHIETLGIAIIEYIMCGGEKVIMSKETGVYAENKEHFDENCLIDTENVKYEEIKEKILNAEKYKIRDREKIVEKYSDRRGILDELNNIFMLGKSNPGDRFWQKHFYIHKNIFKSEEKDVDEADVVMKEDEVAEWKVKIEKKVGEGRENIKIIWNIQGEEGLNEFARIISKLAPLYKMRIDKLEPIPESQSKMRIETTLTLRSQIVPLMVRRG